MDRSLSDDLQLHIQCLMNECFAYMSSKELKHMNKAREQLTIFIGENFTPKRYPHAR